MVEDSSHTDVCPVSSPSGAGRLCWIKAKNTYATAEHLLVGDLKSPVATVYYDGISSRDKEERWAASCGLPGAPKIANSTTMEEAKGLVESLVCQWFGFAARTATPEDTQPEQSEGHPNNLSRLIEAAESARFRLFDRSPSNDPLCIELDAALQPYRSGK